MTTDMQFGFKKHHSTMQCTYVLNEIVGYYTECQSPVYVALLDASRAFDRVHYGKLFRLLLSRGICPALVKFIAFMYTSQSLSVRWNSVMSENFDCSNGIKQGGVLSPVLFCVYMDELLGRLRDSGIGCFVGNLFCGALSYADDLAILAPTHYATCQLLNTCESFANEFHVLFNSAKSHLLYFSPHPRMRRSNKLFLINGETIDFVDSAIHLGTYIGKNANVLSMRRVSSELYTKMNTVKSLYKHCSVDVLRALFKSYCTSFFGSPLWNLGRVEFDELFICYKKCVKHLLGLDMRTRSMYLPVIMDQSDLPTLLRCRFASFWNNCIHSNNAIVHICTKISPSSATSVGSNLLQLAQFLQCNLAELEHSSHTLKKRILIKSKSLVTNDSIARGLVIKEILEIKKGLLSCFLSAAELDHMLFNICII